MTDRIETAGGNFFEQLPGDHDVHLLSMILHDWDEAKNRALLRPKGLRRTGAQASLGKPTGDQTRPQTKNIENNPMHSS